jgi:uncharacterized protein (TIGR02466 family)
MKRLTVEINCYEIFPTLVHEFQFDPSNREEMIALVRELNARGGYKYDRLNEEKEFAHFTTYVHGLCEQILEYQGYEYNSIEITQMWPNLMGYGSVLLQHSHPNSFLSGVWYLQTPEKTAPLRFHDSGIKQVIRPRRKERNRFNKEMQAFPAEYGKGLLFSGWMPHSVPQIKTPGDLERISISWNTQVKGYYGEPGMLQNMEII